MNNKIEFESICADSSGIRNHIFYLNDRYDQDCHDTCIIWNNITFYGVPFDLTEDQGDRVYEGHYDDIVKIGDIFGCMVLCKRILDEGYNPWEICDDENGDLEYTMSALSDKGGPLNIETGEPYQDVYYIHEFKMIPKYDNEFLKSRIIEEFPGLILKLLHVAPDIITYYPAPLEYELDSDKESRYDNLQAIVAQRLDSLTNRINDDEKEKQNNDKKVLKFGDIYRFSDDEINYIMGRRYSGSSYPEEAKDKEEYDFYENYGFREVGDSRLLYKEVTL